MEETVMEVTKSKQEYKKLKKMLKKAYKASVKGNQLDAFIEEAKKNFPGYMDAQKAYEEAPKGADAAQYAALNRVEADFYEAYLEQINERRKTGEKAFRLRCLVGGKLIHAGEKENEEE